MMGSIGTDAEAVVPSPATPGSPADFTDRAPEATVAGGGPHIAARAETGSTWVNLQRDKLIRRSLLVADVTAFVAAVVALSLVTNRPLRITWVGVGGLIALVVGAKIFGLYDRDESLLAQDDAG